jgi:hypothetical protein
MLTIILLIGLSLLLLPHVVSEARAQGPGVTGKVYGFDMYGNLVTLSWARVAARWENLEFAAYTRSGDFELFLPPGLYNITVSCQGYFPKSMMVSVSPGSSASIDFTLEPTGVPIPEFSDGVVWLAGVAMLMCLVATSRRRRKNHGSSCVGSVTVGMC